MMQDFVVLSCVIRHKMGKYTLVLTVTEIFMAK